MKNQTIFCPTCLKYHEVKVSFNKDKPIALISMECDFSTNEVEKIKALGRTDDEFPDNILNEVLKYSTKSGSKNEEFLLESLKVVVQEV